MEPPDHTRLRRLVSAAFARGHVERLRPWVRGAGGSWSTAWSTGRAAPSRSTCSPAWPSRCRWPSSPSCSACPTPTGPAAALVPGDREDVRVRPDDGRPRRPPSARPTSSPPTCARWPPSAARTRATTCSRIWCSVRDAEGDRLTEDELVTTCILLLNAGHEATVNAFGNGLVALLRAPGSAAAAAGRPGPAADGDRGAHALRLTAAAVRAHGHRGRRDRRRSRSRPARRSPPCSARRTATPPSSMTPTPRRRPHGEPAHLLRRRRPLLHRGTAGPGRAAGVVRRAAGPDVEARTRRRAGPPSGIRHPRPRRPARRAESISRPPASTATTCRSGGAKRVRRPRGTPGPRLDHDHAIQVPARFGQQSPRRCRGVG